MRILVTGHAGFIGSHVCEALLKKGYSVVGVDNFCDNYDPNIKRDNVDRLGRDVDTQEGDIRDVNFLESIFILYAFDKVIHLAALAGVRPSFENPLDYETTNIEATRKLLELSVKYHIENFLFASSSSVYGAAAQLPLKEEYVTDSPISPYALTKKAAEMYCKLFATTFKLPVKCLRFFNVYGPRARPDTVLHKFTKLALSREALPIYGDGKDCRDYTYITDIVEGIMSALEYDSVFDVFNLGAAATTQLSTLVEILEKNLGRKLLQENKEAQIGDVPTTHADIEKACKLLDFSPKVSLKEGIKLFTEWYREKEGM